MICFCTKCGRKIEFSADEVRHQQGMVVCPKCLNTFRAPRLSDDDDETPPPIPVRKPKSQPVAPTPKPAPKRPAAKAAAPRKPVPRKAAPKKPDNKSGNSPTSKIGCLLYSAGITLAFFLLDALFGIIFSKI